MRRRREGRALLELPGRRSEREGGEGVWKIAVGEGGESGTGKKRAKVPLLRGGGFGLILTWRRWWLKQRQSTSPPPPPLCFSPQAEKGPSLLLRWGSGIWTCYLELPFLRGREEGEEGGRGWPHPSVGMAFRGWEGELLGEREGVTTTVPPPSFCRR